MHSAALYLGPVLAAEKSKTPYYIAGGVLVVWALFVSIAIGLRNPRFPGGQAGQRAVMAISAVLVVATLTTAVVTAGTPAKAGATTSSTPAASAPASSSASNALSIAANPSGALAFSTKSLAAKAGTVTITMTNMSPLEHNFTLAQGTKVLGATPTFLGGSKSLTLGLKPGTYTFYCSVPGHRQAGMEGTLTVS